MAQVRRGAKVRGKCSAGQACLQEVSGGFERGVRTSLFLQDSPGGISPTVMAMLEVLSGEGSRLYCYTAKKTIPIPLGSGSLLLQSRAAF